MENRIDDTSKKHKKKKGYRTAAVQAQKEALKLLQTTGKIKSISEEEAYQIYLNEQNKMTAYNRKYAKQSGQSHQAARRILR